MRKLVMVGAALMLAACGKGSDTAEAPVAKASVAGSETENAEKLGGEETKKVGVEMSVTTKSPEALAAFQKGRDLLENIRGAEGLVELKKATELDPTFALAYAYLATGTPGDEAQKIAEKAVSLAASAPEAERLYIEALLDQRNFKLTEANAKFAKAADLAPGDARLANQLGYLATDAQRYEDALRWFDKSRAAKPDLAITYNGIAYVNSQLGKWDEAIAAAKKQVELLPNEANPKDTYAEMLLGAGKLDEAAQAYQDVLATSPKFMFAWHGLAITRGYQGDWKGANEANAKQHAGATEPGDKLGADVDLAWLKMAEGKTAESLAALDAAVKQAEAAKQPTGRLIRDRAWILLCAGKGADALKALAELKRRLPSLPEGLRSELSWDGASLTVRAAALTGKSVADAEKALAEMEAAAKADPDEGKTYTVAWHHGLISLMKGDAKAAATELSKCHADDLECRIFLAQAQEKAGDKAAALATRQALTAPRRSTRFLWAHRQWAQK